MSKARMKKSASQVPVPQTRGDMENLLAQIAGLKREEAYIKGWMDQRIAEIKEDNEKDLVTVDEKLKPLLHAAETWATSNPAEFGKAKSITMLHGKIGFRTGTPALEPRSKWNWEKVTEAVQRLLPNFIRDKPEVDRAAIIAQRDDLKEFLPDCGLRIVQDESFFVETNLTPVEKRETVTK